MECWTSIQEGMATTLLKKNENESISVNFGENLVIALKNIKVLRLLKCELTPNLYQFFSLEEDLWVSIHKFCDITSYYFS